MLWNNMYRSKYYKGEVQDMSLQELISLLVVLVLVFFVTIAPNVSEKVNLGVVVSFGVNGLLWSFLIVLKMRSKPFSLNLIQYFFCLFFFFFAAIKQYLHGHFPWVSGHDESTILFANAILLLWTIFYEVGSFYAKGLPIVVNNRFITQGYRCWNGYKKFLWIVTIISFLVMVYRASTIGVVNLFSLGTTSNHGISENSALNALFFKVMMYMTYYGVAFSIYYYKKTQKKFFLISNVFCLLLSYFPTAVARNNVAGIYIGLLLLSFSSLRRNRKFILVYIIGFLFVFPFLNAFRLSSFAEVNLVDAALFTLTNFSKDWLACDYDAYSMLCTTIEYVELNGLSNGMQLLGVIFFWIPRSIWIAKPEGTGEMIGASLGWSFYNVSEPLVAESFLNFGVVGIILFSTAFGYFLTRLDEFFWKSHRSDIGLIHKFDSLYYFMIGYSLFFFRGAMLSATAYLAASFVAWFLCTRGESYLAKYNEN